MFARVDHVAVSVKDMANAIAFYRDVIGMEQVFDREFDEPMARLIGVEGTRVRIVHMRLGDSVVELFDYRHPTGRDPRPDHADEPDARDVLIPPIRYIRQSDYGLTHIGFRVQDFWSTYQHLLDHGVEFLGEPVEIRPGVLVAYFRGAEYEVCEIREIVS
ncbi:MAG TPA: VOC family protein [Anaerolineae bacterium]|nr:VOC family protein [Anaerolineae bacterium]